MPRIISIQLLVNDFGNLGSPIQQASIYPAEAVLGLPASVHSYALLPIGYPMGRFGPVRHVPLVNVVYEDRWGQAYRDL